jgi:hypothetical protein
MVVGYHPATLKPAAEMAAPSSGTSAEDWMAQPSVSFIEFVPGSGANAAKGIGNSKLLATMSRNDVRRTFIKVISRRFLRSNCGSQSNKQQCFFQSTIAGFLKG